MTRTAIDTWIRIERLTADTCYAELTAARAPFHQLDQHLLTRLPIEQRPTLPRLDTPLLTRLLRA